MTPAGVSYLCESLLKKSPLCVGRSPDRVAPEGHGAQGEGPFQSPRNLGTWGMCWERHPGPLEAVGWRRVRAWGARRPARAGPGAARGARRGSRSQAQPRPSAFGSPRGRRAPRPGAPVALRSRKGKPTRLSAEPRHRRWPCWSSRLPLESTNGARRGAEDPGRGTSWPHGSIHTQLLPPPFSSGVPGPWRNWGKEAGAGRAGMPVSGCQDSLLGRLCGPQTQFA